MRRDLSTFDPGSYRLGRGKTVAGLWWVVLNTAFRAWWFPRRLRPSILRAFGANVGSGVQIRHRVDIYWPWKLSIGDHVWIGVDTMIINHEQVNIGSNVCISQRSVVCSSGHDPKSPGLNYRHSQVRIEDGAWVTLGCAVLPGSVVPENLVLPPGSVFGSGGDQ